MLRFSSIQGNSIKLDGGSMFGNAPKVLWSKWAQPDESNRIKLSCRSLLVETDNHKILFETGIGLYMMPQYRKRFGVEEDSNILLKSLSEHNLSHEDITEIILSHLHFDHAGGLLSSWQDDQKTKLIFPNANYYVGQEAFERSVSPHFRDKASFIPDLGNMLEYSGRLKKINQNSQLAFDELKVAFFQSHGHTPGMNCADINWDTGRMIFAADLIPGRFWVNLPITMGYDRFPERLIDEKKELLSYVAKKNAWLFYTHDKDIAASKIIYNSKNHKFEVCDEVEFFSRITF